MRALFLVALLAMPAAASAQDEDVAVPCEEGRERVSGRCCWPGQTWSEERARCEGAPRCPEALVEHGDACIGTAPVESPVGPTLAPPIMPGWGGVAGGSTSMAAATTAGWPPSGGREPTHRALTSRGEDEGIITMSMIFFDIGWVLGWIGVLVDETVGGGGCGFGFFPGGGGGRHSCDSWPLAFIPVAGGLAASIATFNESRQNFTSLGHGIASLIIQLIGVVAIPIALANETTELVFQPLRVAPGVTASVDLSAPGTDTGASLTLSF